MIDKSRQGTRTSPRSKARPNNNSSRQQPTGGVASKKAIASKRPSVTFKKLASPIQQGKASQESSAKSKKKRGSKGNEAVEEKIKNLLKPKGMVERLGPKPGPITNRLGPSLEDRLGPKSGESKSKPTKKGKSSKK